MGVFKSMRDLQKQTREMEKNMPSAGERMAQAQARMANLSNMLDAQTAAAQATANAANAMANGTGVRRTCTITGMRQVGMINFDLLVQFDLTVMSDDMPPYPASAQQAVSQMQIGQVRPGMSVDGTIDQSNPTAVFLDLTTLR
jgi:hypothetical protein